MEIDQEIGGPPSPPSPQPEPQQILHKGRPLKSDADKIRDLRNQVKRLKRLIDEESPQYHVSVDQVQALTATFDSSKRENEVTTVLTPDQLLEKEANKLTIDEMKKYFQEQHVPIPTGKILKKLRDGDDKETVTYNSLYIDHRTRQW
jgi:hypothetical protein